jgi:hypothetical protein
MADGRCFSSRPLLHRSQFGHHFREEIGPGPFKPGVDGIHDPEFVTGGGDLTPSGNAVIGLNDSRRKEQAGHRDIPGIDAHGYPDLGREFSGQFPKQTL